ncbi:hypothetical protein [Streptomyces sp. NPDC056061]|uniref:hypothetical protein n=1 Tax=Streptomyces sp. NPDC056061 TaxID=3345700 RepID=UPI0035DC9789
MGRPNEVSGAPATPTPGGGRDPHPPAPASGPGGRPAAATEGSVAEGSATENAVAKGSVAEGSAHRGAAEGVRGGGPRDGAPAASQPANATAPGAAAGDTAGRDAAALRAPEIAHPVPACTRTLARRGPADPVTSLMARHRELCRRAVDPLEIAAGLENHGMTDRAAARYRHRDVFSLAEELFARVPAAEDSAAAHRTPERDTTTRAAWSLRALAPGAACLATLGVLRLTEGSLGGQTRLAIGLAGTLLGLLGLALCLRSGPLHAVGGPTAAAHVYGCWLLGYVLYGDALLDQVLSGGPEGPWALTPAPLLGLALSVAPAAWCVHLVSLRAHRALIGSRTLEEFTARVRPLLFGAVAVHLGALAALLYLARLVHGGGGSLAGAAVLGVLLLLARLSTVRGFPGPATVALAAACAVEALAPALVLAGRLPGLHALARPVDLLVAAAGTGAVPVLACGASAFGLLINAHHTLSRASAHAPGRPGDEAHPTA